jgi:acyl carrier protein
VVPVRADVADEARLSQVLEELRRDLPPFRGIVHAAGVLGDAPLTELDGERLRAVLRPKAVGAWNLHRLTEGLPLDFFVMFSSFASWHGIPGQGAYAAANAFLDGLAHHRRARGLPALSIGWGGWRGLGFAATSGGERALDYLARRGVERFTPEQGLAALGELLSAEGPARVVVAAVDRAAFDERGSAHAQPGPAPVAGFRDALLSAQPATRRLSMLEAHVGEQAARVLRLAPSELNPRVPFRELGLDSLMAVELRNRLEASLGVSLSTTLVWQRPTVEALAGHLETLLAPAGSPAEPAASAVAVDADEARLKELLAELEQLSDEDVRRRLGNG